LNLQIRFEIFNLLNHPNFNPLPGTTNPGNSSFGNTSQTPDIAAGNAFLSQGGARAAQIGAKIIF
jgi:hypothetical protein